VRTLLELRELRSALDKLLAKQGAE